MVVVVRQRGPGHRQGGKIRLVYRAFRLERHHLELEHRGHMEMGEEAQLKKNSGYHILLSVNAKDASVRSNALGFSQFPYWYPELAKSSV